MNGATEGSFKREARRFDLVHVAAHGIYDDADPLQSYLAFDASPGDYGRLTAQEVLRLKLPAQLVILSACDMAVGRPAAGEGLIGVTWAFMIAGAEPSSPPSGKSTPKPPPASCSNSTEPSPPAHPPPPPSAPPNSPSSAPLAGSTPSTGPRSWMWGGGE